MVREFKLPDVGEGLTEAEIVSWLVEPGDTVEEDQPVAEVETDKAVVEVPAPVNGTVREILAEEGEMVPVGEVIITFDTAEETSASSQASPDDVEGEPGVEEADPVTDEDQPRSETDAAEVADDVGDGQDDAESAVEPIESESEAGEEDGADVTRGRTFAAPSARRLARELAVDVDAVDGSGPGGRVTEGDVRAHAESGGEGGAAAGEREAEPAAEAGRADSGVESATRKVVEEAEGGAEIPTESARAATATSAEAAGRDRTLTAPATRKLAEDLGVDIDDVPASERKEGEPFVTQEDVRTYAEAQQAAQAADAEAVSAGAEAAPTGRGAAPAAEKREERVPYRGIRRTIGDAMERSKYTAPHVTHHDEVDVTDLVESRSRLKAAAEERGVKLTYLPFVIKAVVAALKEYPVLNSQLDEDNEEIVRKFYYNVGVAVATDAGLMVPVVQEADRKGMLQIASEVNELATKARDRSIAREEMQGGTFSITNFGAVGGEYATPIINYPETAILGLGAIKEKPRVIEGDVVPRKVLTLSLSIDHRVIDGAEAARFTNTIKRYLETPELLLLE